MLQARAAMTSRALLLAAVCLQVVTACKNCVVLGKMERAMFRAHSEACSAQSGAEPQLVAALVRGELPARPAAALQRHVLCVLHRCKVVGKDGKLLKSAALGKLAARNDAKNATKVLEQCAERAASAASSPEEAAWTLFRCGYDRKAALFDYMPPGDPGDTGDPQPPAD